MKKRLSDSLKSADGQKAFVEVDETYIGGIETKKRRRKKLGLGSGTGGKHPALGMRQRNGKTRAFLLDNAAMFTPTASNRSGLS